MGRVVRYTAGGIEYEADPKHRKRLKWDWKCLRVWFVSFGVGRLRLGWLTSVNELWRRQPDSQPLFV